MSINIFLSLEGIEGDAQDNEHKNEIDVLSWSWGVSIGEASGNARTKKSGHANAEDLSIVKPVDRSSPDLLLKTFDGSYIKTGTLTITQSGPRRSDVLVIELENISVRSVSVGGSRGDDRLTENIVLSFSTFTYSHTPRDAKGKPGSAETVGWDLDKNKKA